MKSNILTILPVCLMGVATLPVGFKLPNGAKTDIAKDTMTSVAGKMLENDEVNKGDFGQDIVEHRDTSKSKAWYDKAGLNKQYDPDDKFGQAIRDRIDNPWQIAPHRDPKYGPTQRDEAKKAVSYASIAGGAVGGAAGSAAGTAILPEVGTVIGGAAGSVAGAKAVDALGNKIIDSFPTERNGKPIDLNGEEIHPLVQANSLDEIIPKAQLDKLNNVKDRLNELERIKRIENGQGPYNIDKAASENPEKPDAKVESTFGDKYEKNIAQKNEEEFDKNKTKESDVSEEIKEPNDETTEVDQNKDGEKGDSPDTPLKQGETPLTGDEDKSKGLPDSTDSTAENKGDVKGKEKDGAEADQTAADASSEENGEKQFAEGGVENKDNTDKDLDVEAAPGEPAPQELAPQEPAPEEPAPQELAPQEPAPEEPAPQEPAPEEPAPQEPAPEEPAPEEPAPQEPAPEEPAPEEPAPEEPAPEEPVPEEPAQE